jgi:GldM C-terminal domain
MKFFLLLVLFPLAFYAQNDSVNSIKPKLSVIGLDGMNVVYRGVANPISIAVSNAKSFKVSGEGVTKKEDGNYVIKPKLGNETKVVLEIQTSDSTTVVEEHKFRVKPLPLVALLVNNKGCLNGDCTIDIPNKDLLNAQISVKLVDFLLDYTISVTGFRLYLTNSSGTTLASYEIKGNTIPQDVYDEISTNDRASLIFIHKLTFSTDLSLFVSKTPLIKIKKV